MEWNELNEWILKLVWVEFVLQGWPTLRIKWENDTVQYQADARFFLKFPVLYVPQSDVSMATHQRKRIKKFPLRIKWENDMVQYQTDVGFFLNFPVLYVPQSDVSMATRQQCAIPLLANLQLCWFLSRKTNKNFLWF